MGGQSRTGNAVNPPPKVSVLMPAYNHQEYVAQAVESVWNQTFTGIELVAIDDGSNDSTLEILKDLEGRSPIPMFVGAQANAGISKTLNRALAQARGTWVCLLASDDFYDEAFVERNLEVAIPHENENLVQHSDAFLVEADGLVTGVLSKISVQRPLQGSCFNTLAVGNGLLLPSSMFLKTELLTSIGGFDPDLANEDYDIQLRLSRISRFHFINQPLVYSRHTPGSLGKQPWRFGDSTIAALKKHSDMLGDGLSEVLRTRSLILASSCFEFGRLGTGFKWGGRAFNYAHGGSAKIRTAWNFVRSLVRGIVRFLAIRLLGRNRLVVMKRRLIRKS